MNKYALVFFERGPLSLLVEGSVPIIHVRESMVCTIGKNIVVP